MDSVIITDKIICVSKLLASIPRHLCCGALLWFAGLVRDDNKGKGVSGIFYECYEPMTKKEIERIVQEAKEKWPVHQIAVAHRIGQLNVGETSLIVIATAPHRKEAFVAIQYVIDKIKERAPIWKKEIYETGEEKWLQ